MKAVKIIENADKFTVDLVATEVFTAFKGNQKVEADKISRLTSTFEERGEIRVREHERISFRTDVEYPEFNNIEPVFECCPDFRWEKGMNVSVSQAIAKSENGTRKEIIITVTGTTPHLVPVVKGERLMIMKFKKKEELINFKLVSHV